MLRKSAHKGTAQNGYLKSNTKQFTKENVERTSRVEFTLEYARGYKGGNRSCACERR